MSSGKSMIPRALMLPDSTVADSKKLKKKRKSSDQSSKDVPNKKTKKIVKKKKPIKKKVKANTKSDDFTPEELDLDKEIHPIGHFIQDRSEMVKQMFTALEKPKLTSMLPDILKKYNHKEIEQFCCEQLEIMSKKRIRSLLSGVKDEDISSSGTEDESMSETEDICIAEISNDGTNQPPDSTCADVEACSVDKQEDTEQKAITLALGMGKASFSENNLELLELEMRARAIKRMLQTQQESDDAEPISEGSECVEDNTVMKEDRCDARNIADSDSVHVEGENVDGQRSISTTDDGERQIETSSSLRDHDNTAKNCVQMDEGQECVVTELKYNSQTPERVKAVLNTDRCESNDRGRESACELITNQRQSRQDEEDISTQIPGPDEPLKIESGECGSHVELIEVDSNHTTNHQSEKKHSQGNKVSKTLELGSTAETPGANEYPGPLPEVISEGRITSGIFASQAESNVLPEAVEGINRKEVPQMEQPLSGDLTEGTKINAELEKELSPLKEDRNEHRNEGSEESPKIFQTNTSGGIELNVNIQQTNHSSIPTAQLSAGNDTKSKQLNTQPCLELNKAKATQDPGLKDPAVNEHESIPSSINITTDKPCANTHPPQDDVKTKSGTQASQYCDSTSDQGQEIPGEVLDVNVGENDQFDSDSSVEEEEKTLKEPLSDVEDNQMKMCRKRKDSKERSKTPEITAQRYRRLNYDKNSSSKTFASKQSVKTRPSASPRKDNFKTEINSTSSREKPEREKCAKSDMWYDNSSKYREGKKQPEIRNKRSESNSNDKVASQMFGGQGGYDADVSSGHSSKSQGVGRLSSARGFNNDSRNRQDRRTSSQESGKVSAKQRTLVSRKNESLNKIPKSTQFDAQKYQPTRIIKTFEEVPSSSTRRQVVNRRETQLSLERNRSVKRCKSPIRFPTSEHISDEEVLEIAPRQRNRTKPLVVVLSDSD